MHNKNSFLLPQATFFYCSFEGRVSSKYDKKYTCASFRLQKDDFACIFVFQKTILSMFFIFREKILIIYNSSLIPAQNLKRTLSVRYLSSICPPSTTVDTRQIYGRYTIDTRQISIGVPQEYCPISNRRNAVPQPSWVSIVQKIAIFSPFSCTLANFIVTLQSIR